MASVSNFNPLAPETVECPYPFYAALRREAPVYQVPGAGFFIVSRYRDIETVLLDTETFTSKTGPGVRKEPPKEVIEILSQGWMPVDTLLTNNSPSRSGRTGPRLPGWTKTVRAELCRSTNDQWPS